MPVEVVAVAPETAVTPVGAVAVPQIQLMSPLPFVAGFKPSVLPLKAVAALLPKVMVMPPPATTTDDTYLPEISVPAATPPKVLPSVGHEPWLL